VLSWKVSVQGWGRDGGNYPVHCPGGMNSLESAFGEIGYKRDIEIMDGLV
jgi:hypothetical protein